MAAETPSSHPSSSWDEETLETALRSSLTLLDPAGEFRERVRLRLLEAELAPSARFPWQESLPRGVLVGAVALSIAGAALFWWRSRHVPLRSGAESASGL